MFESRIGHTKAAGAAARSFPKLTRPPERRRRLGHVQGIRRGGQEARRRVSQEEEGCGTRSRNGSRCVNVELLLARLEERLRQVKYRQSQIDIVHYEVIASTKIQTRKTSWMLLEGEVNGLTHTIDLIRRMNDVQSTD